MFQVGGNWLELPAGKYRMRNQGGQLPITSHAQIEVDCAFNTLVSHDPMSDPKWSKNAPLRIMSFDIECAGRKGHFPDAQIDPVIQIASMVTTRRHLLEPHLVLRVLRWVLSF